MLSINYMQAFLKKDKLKNCEFMKGWKMKSSFTCKAKKLTMKVRDEKKKV